MLQIYYAFSVVFPLIAIMGIGYGLGIHGFLSTEYTTVANKLVFKVLLPVLLFYNLYKSEVSIMDQSAMIFFVSVAVLVLIAVLYLAVPGFVRDDHRRGVVIQAVYRSNFLIIAVPVIESVYGASGTVSAILLNAVLSPLFNATAVVVLTLYATAGQGGGGSGRILRSILTNPPIIGTVAGILFHSAKIVLPGFVETTLALISQAVIPVALLTLGSSFRFRNARQNRRILAGVMAVKFLLVPLVIGFAAFLLGFRQLELLSILMVFVSPVAILSYVMTQEFGGDSELAGQLVVFSSVVSMFAIFALIVILKTLALL
ncbi:MAG: hypothetical protein AVO33_06905 [delta proteobacterium ML8_F1]|nr:MAG: hypothetical protein AVO33_06905 [delta proteobacterium ML8_F1]